MGLLQSPWPRRAISTGVVLFWLVMTAGLVSRQQSQRRPVVTAEEDAASTSSAESFMVIELEGRRIGLVHTRRGAEARDGAPGAAMHSEARLELAVLGVATEIVMKASVWHALGMPVATLEARLEAPQQSLRVSGVVREGQFLGELQTGGSTLPLTSRIDPALLDPRGVLTTLPAHELSPGREVRILGLDPWSLQPATIRLRCLAVEQITVLGRSTPARKVALTAGGTSMTAWLDEGGELLQAELPLGLVLRTVSPAEAAETAVAGMPADLIDRVVVRPTGLSPRRGARRMVVRVSGLDTTVDIPADDTQVQVTPGVWVVTVPAPGERPGNTAPQPGSPEVMAEPLVQSDHPRIQEQVRAIADPGFGPWQRAQAIHRWVHRTLAKEPAPGMPSALEVLATRRGDCNEHTVLFTALARASGLPTRMAVGLVWSEELEAFAYHAWPEVFVGRWTWMDPTLGQDVADATHLKLLTGDVMAWPRVTAYLGRLRLQVLEIS